MAVCECLGCAFACSGVVFVYLGFCCFKVWVYCFCLNDSFCLLELLVCYVTLLT